MYTSSSYQESSANSEIQDQLSNLRALTDFLDTKFKGPFGIKVGWDGLLGIIPGIGDLITSLLSFYIIGQAALIGASPAVLVRMCLNVLIDNVLDMVPFLGIFFDIFWKSNVKNLKLLESYLQNPKSTRNKSIFVVSLIIASFLVVILGILVLSVWLISYLISLIF